MKLMLSSETGMENGMIDLNHSLLELVRKEITIENAYQYSLNPKGLRENALIFKYYVIQISINR